MEIAEKIKHSSLAEIRIYKEGVFWIAYEQSAYWIHLQKGYRPTKKFVKCIGREVVSVGFPDNALQELRNFVPCDNGEQSVEKRHCLFSTLENAIDQEAFETWKNNIPVIKNLPRNLPTNKGIAVPSADNNGVLQQIKNFDLSNATPIDCVNFVAMLQKITHNS